MCIKASKGTDTRFVTHHTEEKGIRVWIVSIESKIEEVYR